ncbi:early nodulin-like protein 18 [Silene latifolia]|uniref:early nodulin-like protein 18 n=1 Tax=Silene latifolia TaxID=37657 RepID=UPI003D7896E2
MEHKFRMKGLFKHNNNNNNNNMNNIIMKCMNVLLICLILGKIQSVEAYKNYTVGDSLGWFDKLTKPSIDYGKWVSGKSFSLGDFLIFNTDNNHTVIQTYNLNTYTKCDGQGDDDILWAIMDPNTTSVVQPITVAVPLMKEGPTYFFSGNYDGEQCLNGQKFAIKVSHGKGLPPSLKEDPNFALGPTPANSAPSPTNADSGDDQAAPDTVVPADFNHPKKVPSEDDDSSDDSGDDTKKSNDASFILSNREGFLFSLISGILVFIWI